MGMAHALASSMGGIKTAGDLVARMQLKKMRLTEAKEYVAGKLGVSVVRPDRLDPDAHAARRARHRPRSPPCRASAKGLEAKSRIADLLDIKINSVERLKAKIGAPLATH